MNKAILSEPKHPVGRRPRVLIFIVGYPTFSETYMHEEIRSLWPDYEIKILTYSKSDFPRDNPFPYEIVEYKVHAWSTVQSKMQDQNSTAGDKDCSCTKFTKLYEGSSRTFSMLIIWVWDCYFESCLNTLKYLLRSELTRWMCFQSRPTSSRLWLKRPIVPGA